MIQTATTPIPRAFSPVTVGEAIKRLNDFDFGEVREYVTRKGIYASDEVDDVELEYKRFIALVVGTGQPQIMAKSVDDYWHAHLLFTRSYKQMAAALNVRGIDHQPTKSEEERLALIGGYNVTHDVYTEHFGKPNPKYWGANGQICMGEGESYGMIDNPPAITDGID